MIHNWTHMFNEISITNVIEHTAINMWKWWIKNLSFVNCWDLFDWSVEICSIDRLYAMYRGHAVQCTYTKTTEKGSASMNIKAYKKKPKLYQCVWDNSLNMKIIVTRWWKIRMMGGILWYIGNYANFHFIA